MRTDKQLQILAACAEQQSNKLEDVKHPDLMSTLLLNMNQAADAYQSLLVKYDASNTVARHKLHEACDIYFGKLFNFTCTSI